MNLRDLIEALTDIVDDNNDHCEVVVAIQQNYPLAVNLDEITLDLTDPECPRVWIATGSHPHGISPYAPRYAWNGGVVNEDYEEDE
jgi:hypothetical protein